MGCVVYICAKADFIEWVLKGHKTEPNEGAEGAVGVALRFEKSEMSPVSGRRKVESKTHINCRPFQSLSWE